MKLKKESKIRILENFYSLDYTLFGKPVTKMDLCCPSFIEEYMSVKGALMSLVIEMYQLMKHSPKVINEKVDTSTLLKNAKNSAIVARENCQKLVTSAKGRKEVKENLRESLAKSGKNVDIENLVHEKIRTKAFSLAIDNLLIGRAITESKKFAILSIAFPSRRASSFTCFRTFSFAMRISRSAMRSCRASPIVAVCPILVTFMENAVSQCLAACSKKGMNAASKASAFDVGRLLSCTAFVRSDIAIALVISCQIFRGGNHPANCRPVGLGERFG